MHRILYSSFVTTRPRLTKLIATDSHIKKQPKFVLLVII